MTKKTKRAKAFIISASGLAKFFTCPRQYLLSRMYQPRFVPEWMELGSMVHSILETGEVPPGKLGAEASTIAGRISSTVQTEGYDLRDTEVKQFVPLTEGITLVRVLDAIGYRHGIPVVVDYKVPVRPWETVGQKAPKGSGFQAAAYLVADQTQASDWAQADRIDFVVAPRERVGVSIYPYHWNKKDQEELIQAAKIVKEANRRNYFPANRGHACTWCPWQAACYETSGWKSHYTERSRDYDQEETID